MMKDILSPYIPIHMIMLISILLEMLISKICTQFLTVLKILQEVKAKLFVFQEVVVIRLVVDIVLES